MVLSFGDICAFLEGAEKISRRRPRLPSDEEQKLLRRHAADWFKGHREELGE